MVNKMSFKQYLDSKQQLREAVNSLPIERVEYVVNKYGKLPVGESKQSKEVVAVKPKQLLTVEWAIHPNGTRTINHITVEGVDCEYDGEQLTPLWKPEKVQSWLETNTVSA